jgi:hypothetical protein
MIFSLKRRFSGDQNQEKLGSPALISILNTFTPPPSSEGDQMPSIFSRPMKVFGFRIEQLLEVPLFPTFSIFSLPPSVISADDNLLLCSIPTEPEVIKFLLSLGSIKAPGPDGFTALFYKKYWPIVEANVLACIWNFFNNKHLLNEQNHTFIALVPKQNGSHTVHQFRPISHCNIVYKIIFKILANRLKAFLPKIISPLQSTFVPGINIQDNSILAHELLHNFKNKRGKKGFDVS